MAFRSPGDGAARGGGLPFSKLKYADGTAVDMDGFITSAEDDYGGDEDSYYKDKAGV